MNRPLLICAAVEEELHALLPSFRPNGAWWEGSLGRWPALARAVGIGPVEAALGTSEALAATPAAAIFVGTCGAFPSTGLPIGSAVVVHRAELASSDEAAGLSYLPGRQQRRVEADARLAGELAAGRIPLVGAATVVAITRDADRAAGLKEHTGCEVEHQEAFAFLLAAARAGVAACCVLGVANEVGPGAHQQWRTNADPASAAAAELLRSWAARS